MPRERTCLPVEQWPAIDRTLWEGGMREQGLFEAAGAGANWATQSRQKAARGYGSWLKWLQAAGVGDHALSLPPGQRVTQDRVAAYIAHLRESRAPYTVLCHVQELYDALRVLAPDADWGWLAQLYRALRSRVRPVRDKRRRLRPVDELDALGRRLMAEAEHASSWSPRRRAVAYRDGLMIALLAHRPVRMKNFAAMRLGRHLVEQGSRWWMLFSAPELKNHVPYEAVFPAALENHLRHYLERHRPVLLRGEGGGPAADTDALWVSEVGTHLEARALSRRISKSTRAAFGDSLPPHWFRDAAATSIAIDDPIHVRDAHLVLGHAGLATTEKHYNQAQSLQASRRYQAMLAGLRASFGADGSH